MNMNEEETPVPRRPRQSRSTKPSLAAISLGAGFGFALLAAAVLIPAWIWLFWRIEPEPGEIAVLIRKTGKDLPSGQIVATEPGQKGIQREVLAEGRYFYNPFTWGWIIAPITDIPAGKLGVQTRLYGDDLPPGHIIATDSSKGILRDILRPGKHRINPYALHVLLFDAISIPPGRIGVITSLIGKDVLDNELDPGQRNTFLVDKELKGVQAETLDPGTYYINPFVMNVSEVNLQSQRFEMSGEDAISFLTLDGFTVTVEGTIEYAIIREKAAMLTHQVGDMEDVLRKVILPPARGFSRIEGSKNPAKNYIMGDTRQQFQDNLEEHLAKQCARWGVDVKSVLIRNITPPDAIAGIIRDRELAVQNARKYEQQIEQAKSMAELARQEMLAQQNKEKVEAETARIRAVIRAEQDLSVRVTEANRELEVVRLENEASKAQAEAILLTAGAKRDVTRMQNEAEAGVIRDRVAAFGGGMSYARFIFYGKVAPKIQAILSGDGGDGLGALFTPFLPTGRSTTAAQSEPRASSPKKSPQELTP